MSIAGTYADEANKFAGHLIASGTASSSAALDFTINPAYNTHIFEIWNIIPVDNVGRSFNLYVSANSGATWGADYWYQISQTYASGVPGYLASIGTGGGYRSTFYLHTDHLQQSLSGRVTLWSDPARGNVREWFWHLSGYYNPYGASSCYGSGLCSDVGLINYVRFGFNVAMLAGTIRYYGLAK